MRANSRKSHLIFLKFNFNTYIPNELNVIEGDL